MPATVKRLLMMIFVLVAAGTTLTWMVFQPRSLPVPDEKVAAMELLAEKLSGPRYFHAPVSGIQDVNGPWIDVDEARQQQDRVIQERKLDAGQREELNRLISRLTEPQPARMVGGYRIQLERLNLALDGIKK
ncbi:MAG: hypothetical protein ABIS50_09275 [Luteolibacter sp.]|uniref:potassium-transporting ATPase subunit C n=1 Tax=Luteolibacter sp. TaxID=1962973 RepID=UPI003266F006